MKGGHVENSDHERTCPGAFEELATLSVSSENTLEKLTQVGKTFTFVRGAQNTENVQSAGTQDVDLYVPMNLCF